MNRKLFQNQSCLHFCFISNSICLLTSNALHLAALGGSLDIVKYLIDEKGISVDTQGGDKA